MYDNAIKYVIDNKLSPKLNLSCNTSLIHQEINNKKDSKNPLIKLLNNFEEITSIINLNNPNYIEVLYLNRFKAHKILYDNEKIIEIKNENVDSFTFYIYLSLLIEEDIIIVNYSYSANFIYKLNSEQSELKNEKIKKIIIAKIIIDLIINYENNDDAEKNIEIEINLDNIMNFNKKIIKDNINEFKLFKLTENDILSKNIDEIYSLIIKYLIENKKLINSDFTLNIFTQIDINSIYLTTAMFDTLSIILDKEKEYLKEFIIKDYDDLFNNKIINFYFLLFRYVIKDDYYIYQIPFLLEQRNKIKTLIKANLDKFYYSIKSQKKEEIEIKYFLGTFIEYKYYLNESLKVIKESGNFNENLSFNELSVFDFDNRINSNDDSEIIEYENLKLICGNEIAFQILNNSSFKFEFKKDKKNNILCKCSEIKINNIIYTKSLDEIKNIKSKNDIVNNNFTKFLNIQELIIKKIKYEFSSFDFAVTLEFKGDRIVNSIIQTECKYLLEKNNNNIIQFLDNNILEKGPDIGLTFLIEEMHWET